MKSNKHKVVRDIVTASVVSALTIGGVSGILTFLSFSLAVQQSPELPPMICESDDEGGMLPDFERPPPVSRLLRYALFPAGIIMGLLAAFTSGVLVETFLRYFYQYSIGSAYPVFGRGGYLFQPHENRNRQNRRETSENHSSDCRRQRLRPKVEIDTDQQKKIVFLRSAARRS
jgi:hypothetical protein